MKRSKRQIPLTILKAIQPLVNERNRTFASVDPGDSMIMLQDNSVDSDFFYEIVNGDIQNSTVYLEVTCKPLSRNDPTKGKFVISATALNESIKSWVSRIEEYNNVEVFEDTIEIQYQQEFEDEFIKILDDDADVRSFDFPQQLWIDKYLTTVETRLLENKENYQNEEVAVVVGDIVSLKKRQSSMTKKQVISSLAKIWAKTRKLGINLIKEIYVESKKEILKQLISVAIDHIK